MTARLDDKVIIELGDSDTYTEYFGACLSSSTKGESLIFGYSPYQMMPKQILVISNLVSEKIVIKEYEAEGEMGPEPSSVRECDEQTKVCTCL